jgi:hypothetical protein
LGVSAYYYPLVDNLALTFLTLFSLPSHSHLQNHHLSSAPINQLIFTPFYLFNNLISSTMAATTSKATTPKGKVPVAPGKKGFGGRVSKANKPNKARDAMVAMQAYCKLLTIIFE